MDDLNQAAQEVADFLKMLTTTGGLRLKYRITAGPGAADPDGFEDRELYVEFAGPDAPLLIERGGELLRALEHIAALILGLEPEDHELISFDALSFKANRARATRLAADTAAESVRLSGRPYIFPVMTSGERRMLHMALRNHTGLRTESSGEGRDRCVVAYPADYDGPPVEPPRSSSSRGFDRRGPSRGSDRGRDRGFSRSPDRGPDSGPDRRGDSRGNYSPDSRTSDQRDRPEPNYNR